MQIISIKEDSGVAELLEVNRIRTVPVKDISAYIASHGNKVNYPRRSNIIADARNGDRSLWFWEEEPRVRSIGTGWATGKHTNFNIHFPYQVFGINMVNDAIVGMSAFVRNSPVESDRDDKLYSMPLTNVFDHDAANGNICLGQIDLQIPGKVERKIQNAIDTFYGVEFNNHLLDAHFAATPITVREIANITAVPPATTYEGGLLAAWEEHSNRDVEDPWKLEWFDSRHTVTQMLDNI